MSEAMWFFDGVTEIDENGKVTEYPAEWSPCRAALRFFESDEWHRMSRRERELYFFAPAQSEDAT